VEFEAQLDFGERARIFAAPTVSGFEPRVEPLKEEEGDGP